MGFSIPMISNIDLLTQHFDCLFLVHPLINVLEKISQEIQERGVVHLNVSKGLSSSLMTVSLNQRCRFSQKWLMDTLNAYKSKPILCSQPDLLFDPSIEIDPLALFRQISRINQLIVLWPGEYKQSLLSYAVPEHHHYRSWNISDVLLHQPVVLIHRISTPEGE